MTDPAPCHCGSISWERLSGENRYTCCSCKRPLWQPIDTAPKDGTCVLLYGIWSGEVHGSVDEYSILQASFSLNDWLVEGGEYYCAYVINPTHWMPLPAPPKKGDE
jgi:hypothetical protein